MYVLQDNTGEKKVTHRTSKTRIPDYSPIVDGNYDFNSNDAFESQAYIPKDWV
jgi:hypothetical protein